MTAVPDMPNVDNEHFCKGCGVPVTQKSGRKMKRFCSDCYRNNWWNAHLDQVKRKAVYDFICPTCGYIFFNLKHADIMHWLPRYNETMDTFRAAVKAALEQKEDKNMTQDIFHIIMYAWLDENDPLYKTLDDVPTYWREDAAELVKAGAVKGDGINSFGLSHSELKAAIISKRYTDYLLFKGVTNHGKN